MLDVWFFYMFVTASFCRFLFRLILNRKLLGIFEFSLAPLRKRHIFLLFVFSIFYSVLIFLNQTETQTKNPIFCRFCLKTYVFVANKVLIFSDLRIYRANHTPPPRFWHSQGGSALFRKFFIFLFFIFCKIL